MTKLIAEIGINHNGSITEAKKLIDIALSCSCWGIKFQFRDPKNYFKNNTNSAELGKEIIDSEIKKNYLNPAQIKNLSNYASDKGLKVGLSVFAKEDLSKFKTYNFDFYKIPSASSHDYSLINFLKKKKLLIISFGGKSLNEIKKIISDCNLIPSKTTLMHCVSNYPVLEINANLGFIDYLKKKYKKFNIGYSSHEGSIINSILALTKKIDYLERHITLDKLGTGLDHSSSSNQKEFKLLQIYNENLNKIFFEKKKKFPNQGEIINIQNLGMSYYFNKNLPKGSVLKRSDVVLGYPCVGINDLNLKKILNRKIQTNVSKGTPLVEAQFKNINLDSKIILFLKNNNISIPIRPRDYLQISENVPVSNFEMHFSYKDIENFNNNSFSKSFLNKHRFSIHMPDYCDANNIIDFFSSSDLIKRKSTRLLNKSIKISKYINTISKFRTDIIVSLSNILGEHDKFEYYKRIKKLSQSLKKKHKINLLPQWLPVDAWYFGGNLKTNAFSDPRDLNFMKKINLKICMDTSHFILSCNYHNLDHKKYFKQNIKLFSHIHLSDAIGTDGEGVLLGNGETIKKGILKQVMKEKKILKVLETWQGHLNYGFKFKKDCITLYKKTL